MILLFQHQKESKCKVINKVNKKNNQILKEKKNNRNGGIKTNKDFKKTN